MMAAETYIHKPRIAKDCGQHQKQETPGTDSPLEPSERAGPYHTVTSDFQPPEL